MTQSEITGAHKDFSWQTFFNIIFLKFPKPKCYCDSMDGCPMEPTVSEANIGNIIFVLKIIPNTVLVKYGHSLLIISSLGMYHEIHTPKPISIDSVKINPSKVIVRECLFQTKDDKYSAFKLVI